MSALASIIDNLVRLITDRGWRRDRRQKQILRELLSDPRFEWRSIDTLARAIGAPDDRTRELLVMIGARASTGSGREVWALRSRVGGG